MYRCYRSDIGSIGEGDPKSIWRGAASLYNFVIFWFGWAPWQLIISPPYPRIHLNYLEYDRTHLNALFPQGFWESQRSRSSRDVEVKGPGEAQNCQFGPSQPVISSYLSTDPAHEPKSTCFCSFCMLYAK